MGDLFFEGIYTGQTLNDRYRINRLIGRGGVGEVYHGKHLLVGRPVAIKILRDKYAGNRSMIVRFFREAQAAAAIGHKHIIDIFDVGVTEQGDPFIVMEYLEGESLEDFLQRSGRVSLGAACGILEPVLEALSATHEKNIVHRDLKPANIFLSYSSSSTSPVVKLIDFGVAKMPMAPESAQITQTGAMVGTPHYMAPEQIVNAELIDTRTDLFTIGVILYELLTGSLPYDAKGPNAMMKDIVFGATLPPTDLFREFPKEAEPIVMQAMEREIDERYKSAEEMLGDLRSLDAWNERFQEVAKLDHKRESATVAMGTLGEPDDGMSDPDFASEHLAMLAQHCTPVSDDSTLQDIVLIAQNGESTSASSTRSSSIVTISFAPLPLAAAILGFGILVVLGVLYFLNRPKDEGDLATKTENLSSMRFPEPVVKDVVKVTVEGVPEGAKIQFDSKPVPDNPFEVERGFEPVRITIEAEGFEQYESSVIPGDNVVLKVDLHPIKLPEQVAEPSQGENGVQSASGTETAPEMIQYGKKKKRSRTRKKSTEESRDAALRKGNRGLEFIEKFE